jgi:argininosuccinate lyase
MSRFDKQPDPVFWALNASLEFDRRLAPYDVRLSRAHARALVGVGVLDENELARLLEGLDRVEAELADGSFPFEGGDEDIHMAIERRLTELVGPLGGKLHTGRSRNDQVATDLALFVAERGRVAIELLHQVLSSLHALATAHRDWRMPGYTHLQRAQPVYLGHHLLAWFWMLRRDVGRFAAAVRAAAVMPLGSGALAGVNWELDRDSVAGELGFAAIAPNSIDAVANRDFAVDYLAAAASCATHMSRIGAEIVLWSSSEFGFCRPPEEFSSGSSIMPQKMNPDAAELLRAKAPRVLAAYSTVLGVQHALPLAYSKDLQEDKEPLFDAVDTVELCLRALAGTLGGISFERERMATAAADEMVAATDIADLLVRRGMPFREAHEVVGGLVRHALERGIVLSEIERERLGEFSELLDDEYYEVLAAGSWLDSKVSAGGTSAESLTLQLERSREALADVAGLLE